MADEQTPEPAETVTVYVHQTGVAVPVHLADFPEEAAVRLRNELTTHAAVDWMDVEHKGARHRINVASVAHVALHPTRRAWTEEDEIKVLTAE